MCQMAQMSRKTTAPDASAVVCYSRLCAVLRIVIICCLICLEVRQPAVGLMSYGKSSHGHKSDADIGSGTISWSWDVSLSSLIC